MLVKAQNGKLFGVITDNEGKAITGAYVSISSIKLVTISDTSGFFKFTNLEEKDYILSVSFIGFDTTYAMVTVKGNSRINLTLNPKQIMLSPVTIIGMSNTGKVNQSGYSSKAIVMGDIKKRAIEADKILTKTSGVLVRQSGGVGSSMNISLNGLSGKMIRYFYDGIPTEGSYLSPLYSIPLNTLNQIEIYKGVTPEYLACDAIGGAVNFVSIPFNISYTDISFHMSSYGYYKAFAGYRKVFKNGLTAGGYVNYLTAKNNYPVEAEVSDPVTGRVKTDVVKRFHDQFSLMSVRLDIGVVNKKFADLLMFSGIGGNTKKQIQHGILMNEPCGEANVSATNFEGRLVYRKDSIINKHLNIELNHVINQSTLNYIDSTRNIYNWYGQITGQRILGNELYHFDTPHQANLVSVRTFSKLFLNYRINDHLHIKFTSFYSTYRRTGSDPLSAKENGIDPYAAEPRVQSLFSGLSLHTELFRKKVRTITGIKEFIFNASQTMAQDQSGKIKAAGNYTGFWQVIQYQIKPSLMTNFSYEYTYRLPDPNELFGDVVITSPNTALKPENSHNANIGLQLRKEKNRMEYFFAVNAFNRNIKDIIFLGFPVHGAHYSNIFNSRSYGIEADGSLIYKKELSFSLNICWQELKNISNYNYDGTFSTLYYNTRLPNTPWLFGQASIVWAKNDVVLPNTKTEFYSDIYYVHNFFLRPEADGGGSSKYIIPTQLIPNVGITEQFEKIHTSLSFEIHNISGSKSYDNFRVQKPGRTFHLVLRYILK